MTFLSVGIYRRLAKIYKLDTVGKAVPLLGLQDPQDPSSLMPCEQLWHEGPAWVSPVGVV